MKFMHRLLLCAILTATTYASEDEPAAPVRDFGAGVKKFEALGLPSVAGGTYVNLSILNRDNTDVLTSHYGEPNMQGNAWLMDTNDVTPAPFVSGALAFDVTKRKRKEIGELLTNDTGEIFGTWSSAKLEKDIKSVQKFINKDDDEHDWQYRSAQGRLFLFVLHVYQAGYTNEANQMVAGMIRRAKNPRDLISAGVDQLADEQYRRLCRKFYTTHDWNTFATDLDEITARISSSWEKADGVKILCERVKQRINVTNAPIPEITEEQQALVDELLTAKTYPNRWDTTPFWQYAPNSKQKRPKFGAMDTNHPVYRLKALGKNGAPLLLKLIENDTLTTIPINSLGNHSTHTSSEQTPEETFRIGIYRPAMLSDIARQMLLTVQPAENRWELSKLSNEDIAMNAQDWLDTYKDMEPRDIALDLIDKGNKSQRAASMTWLVQNMQSNDYPEIEKFLMDLDVSHHREKELVRTYVEERESEAAEFVEAYLESQFQLSAEKQNEELRKNSDSDDYEKYLEHQDEQNKRFIKQLRSLVTQKPLDQLLADIASGEESLSDHQSGINSRLQKLEPEEAASLLFDTAIQTDNTSIKAPLMRIATGFIRPNYCNRNSEPPLFSAHADKWQALADSIDASSPRTMSDIASLVEVIYENNDKARWVAYVTQDAADFLNIENPTLIRFRERLAGQPEEELSPLPDVESVSQEASLAKAEELLTLTTTDELQTALRKLTLAEFMALRAAVSEDKELAERFTNQNLFISAVKFTPTDTLKVPELAALEGGPVNTDLLQTLKDYGRKQAEQGMVCVISFMRGRMPSGYVLNVVQAPIGETDKIMYFPSAPRVSAALTEAGYIQEQLGVGVKRATIETPLGETAASDNEPEQEAAEEEDLDLMDEIFDELDSSDELEREENELQFEELMERLAPDKEPWKLKRYYIYATPAAAETEETE